MIESVLVVCMGFASIFLMPAIFAFGPDLLRLPELPLPKDYIDGGS